MWNCHQSQYVAVYVVCIEERKSCTRWSSVLGDVIISSHNWTQKKEREQKKKKEKKIIGKELTSSFKNEGGKKWILTV